MDLKIKKTKYSRTDLPVNLPKLARAQGLSLAELARRAGIPKATLHSWTAGVNPNLAQLIQVANFLGRTLEELCISTSQNPARRVYPLFNYSAEAQSTIIDFSP